MKQEGAFYVVSNVGHEWLPTFLIIFFGFRARKAVVLSICYLVEKGCDGRWNGIFLVVGTKSVTAGGNGDKRGGFLAQ